MNNNELIEILSNLQMEEKALSRELDIVYNNLELRTRMFNKIKNVKKEIEKVKFKIRLERELKKNGNINKD